MTDRSSFDDPILVRRLEDWIEDQREVRAPARLVDAVMADVVAQPREGGWAIALRRWQGIAAYGALTAVVAIGVTLGILLAQTIGDEVGHPPASPSLSPSPSPSPGSSNDLAASGAPPVSLLALGDVQIEATALAAGEGGLWVVDRANRLVELDQATGDERRSVPLPRPVAAMLVASTGVWAASVEGDLVRVDRATLELTEIADAIGGALAVGQDARIWLGRENGVARIDPGSNAIDLVVPVANRSPDLGLAAVDSVVWVATRTGIVQLDAGDGAVVARIPGDATALGLDGGSLWASRGIELLRIDPTNATITEIVAGIPAGSSMAIADGRIWVAGPPGAASGTIVGVDAAAARIAFEASVDGSIVDVAVLGASVWVARDEGGSVSRFSVP